MAHAGEMCLSLHWRVPLSGLLHGPLRGALGGCGLLLKHQAGYPLGPEPPREHQESGECHFAGTPAENGLAGLMRRHGMVLPAIVADREED